MLIWLENLDFYWFHREIITPNNLIYRLIYLIRIEGTQIFILPRAPNFFKPALRIGETNYLLTDLKIYRRIGFRLILDDIRKLDNHSESLFERAFFISSNHNKIILSRIAWQSQSLLFIVMIWNSIIKSVISLWNCLKFVLIFSNLLKYFSFF